MRSSTAFLFNSLGGEKPCQQVEAGSIRLIHCPPCLSGCFLLTSPRPWSIPPPAPLPTKLLNPHPGPSILVNKSIRGGSMRQRITKSYQPKPCQISKHNHYVNPSLLLLHKDGLALSSQREQRRSLCSLSLSPLTSAKRVMGTDNIGRCSLNLSAVKCLVQSTVLSPRRRSHRTLGSPKNQGNAAAARHSSITRRGRQEVACPVVLTLAGLADQLFCLYDIKHNSGDFVCFHVYHEVATGWSLICSD